MDIFFKTGGIQKLCSQNAVAQKKLGAKMARKLQQRMMELKAAVTLADISRLPPARCHELKGHRQDKVTACLHFDSTDLDFAQMEQVSTPIICPRANFL